MQYPGEHALSGHDAVPHHMEDLAFRMAFFPYLRDLQHHIITFENTSHRVRFKIISFHQQIFTKSSIRHVRASCAEFFHLFPG